MEADAPLTFRLIERTRASREIAEQIRQSIREGQVRPGTRLPSERELVQQLGVGRAVVCEARRILEVMGLAEIHQGRGTFVKEPPATLDAPRLVRLARRGQRLQA